MKSTKVIRRLHEQRMWANQQIFEAVAGLTEDQLRTTFPIGQGSVWKTLTHLLAAEFVWLEALLGNESPLLPGDISGHLPGNQLGSDAVKDGEELKSRWSELDKRWNEYLDSLTDESLEEWVYKISTSSGLGKKHATKRCDILLHVCTHAQYTIAQLVNMLRQLDCENLPDVMLITMARRVAAG